MTNVEPRICGLLGLVMSRTVSVRLFADAGGALMSKIADCVPAVPITSARFPWTATSRRLIVPGMVNEVVIDMFVGSATLTTSRLPVLLVTLPPPGVSPVT